MSAFAGLKHATEPRKDDPKAEFLSWFQNAPMGIAWCDAEGRLLACNPAMEPLLASVKASEIFHLSDINFNQNRERTAELLSGQCANFQMESAAGPSKPPLHWSAWRTVHAEGPYILASAETFLSTTTAPPEDRLEMLGRLTGGVAHDFNNLLTGVLLYCDLLLATLSSADRARRYAEEIRKAGFEASGLVRQLLSLAKPDGAAPREFSWNETALGMRNFLARLAGETIELKLHLDPGVGLVRMDPAKAQQVILNLVLNARDAMPRGGQITVETSDCKVELLGGPGLDKKSGLHCVLLVVGDNGDGMDANTRTHLFEPFFTTKAGKGTGLGLATVRDIVSSHGGLVHVESAPGRGTRLSVLLPVLPATRSELSGPTDFCPASGGNFRSSNEEE
jgi:signal transduction histidine kinase